MAFRKGQWIKLKSAGTIIGVEEKKGAVAIAYGQAMQPNPDYDPEYAEDATNPRLIPIPGKTEIHFVDVPDGTTRRKVAVDESLFEAITSRSDIPAARLKTMHPKWVPEP